MGKRLLHTPEGVRDIYGVENEKKNIVQYLVMEMYQLSVIIRKHMVEQDMSSDHMILSRLDMQHA